MYSPIQNKKNYQSIVEQIKQMILNKELTIGDQLPTERDLANLYQVSRASVREALKALETIGLLESRQGGGNFIVNNLKDCIADTLSLIFVLDNCTMKDLTNIRYAFEKESIRELLEKNDPQVRQELQAMANKIRKAESNEELGEIDMNFHLYIANQATNPMVQFLHASIHTVYVKSIQFLNSSYPYWPTKKKESLEEDKLYQLDIINALLSGDRPRIEQSLINHYRFYINDSVDIDALYLKLIKKKNND